MDDTDSTQQTGQEGETQLKEPTLWFRIHGPHPGSYDLGRSPCVDAEFYIFQCKFFIFFSNESSGEQFTKLPVEAAYLSTDGLLMSCRDVPCLSEHGPL